MQRILKTMKPQFWLLTLMYCAGLFWLSAQSDPPSPPLFPGADKLIHAFLYAGLAAIVSTGIRRSERATTPRTQFLAPLIFAALYGVSDELHQLFVPSRSFDLLDIAADFLGAAAVQTWLCRRVWRLWAAAPATAD